MGSCKSKKNRIIGASGYGARGKWNRKVDRPKKITKLEREQAVFEHYEFLERLEYPTLSIFDSMWK